MSVPHDQGSRKQVERPPRCPVCGSEAWWNGWREVTRRHLGTSGRVEIEPGQRLHRAVCSSSRHGCSAAGWTVYPQGRYPCRRFDLDVVAGAVAEHTFGRDAEDRPKPLASIGRQHTCSGRSVSRWSCWVAGLSNIEALSRECMRIDPEGMPVAVRGDGVGARGRAGHALAVLDRFAGLLETRGVLPHSDQPSLVRVLEDQRVRHGVTFPLHGRSPPSSRGAADTAPHGR